MNTPLQYLLALVAGGLIYLSLAPYNLWPAALAGLSVFAALAALSDSKKQTFRLALLFGVGLFGAGVNWVYISIHIYGEVPAILAFIFTGGFALFLALLFALPWLLLPVVAKSRTSRLICFPAFWFFSEWIRGWLLTGFPWLYLGYGQVEGPLSGLIPVIGVLGTGTIMAIAASLLVYCADTRNAQSALITALGLAAILALGTGLKETEWTQSRGIQVPVTLVQPDIPLRDKWNPAKAQAIIDILENHSQHAWQPGLLVWPEAAIPYTGPSAIPYVEALDELATRSGTAMFTGLLTYDFEQNRYLNSMIGLGDTDSIYHKQRLVPFGEYVPLEDWLRGTMKFFDLPMSVISRRASAQQPLQFSYQGQTFYLAPAICYEIAYSGLVRSLTKDADMLVTLSNDAWFGTSIGPWQHMQIAQARALENQKPLLRATNNGVTALVSHQGKIIGTVPQFIRTKLGSKVTPRSGTTPYAQSGNGPLLFFALVILAFAATFSRKTADSPKPVESPEPIEKQEG